MKCVHCGRALTKPALTIPSKHGLLAWGPKCARALRKAASTPRTAKPVRWHEAMTPDLFEDVAA